MSETAAPCDPTEYENTDRHLWPETSPVDAPEEKLFVTSAGGVGINIGGHVIVRPLREWHRLAASQPDRSDPSPGPDVSLSAPVGEPVAWLVKWFSANGDSGIKAHTDEQNAKRAAENIERYRSSNSTAVVIPLYTHPPAPAVGPDVREALARSIEGIILRRVYEKRIEGYTLEMSLEQADAILSALTRPLGGFVQGSIARKQSTDPEGSSRTETAGGDS